MKYTKEELMDALQDADPALLISDLDHCNNHEELIIWAVLNFFRYGSNDKSTEDILRSALSDMMDFEEFRYG